MNRKERRAAERDAAKAARKTGARPAAGDPLTRAAALLERGEGAQAETLLRPALEANPADARALALLSTSLRLQEQFDEAVASGRRAVMRDRHSAEAQTALAEALRAQDRVFEAMPAHEAAVALAPQHAESHHAYGLSLMEVGDLPAAVARLRRACELQPLSVRYLNSLGIALVSMGAFPEAVPIFDTAISANPQNPHMHFNRSFALHGSGRLGAGWDDYEYGFAAKRRLPTRTFPVPRWEGSTLPLGQRLLVWREQGIGDEIRFASCYPEAVSATPDVVIEADPRLVALFRRSFPTAAVRTPSCDDDGASTQVTPDYHAEIPAGSLAGLYRRRLEDYPEHRGYLVADPRRSEEFKRRLEEHDSRLKVGICWRSMRLNVKRLLGYTTLEEWAPIFAVSGVTFVNLQYGSHDLLETELRAHEESGAPHIVRWDDLDYTDDQDSVAALIDAVDLVISVNTAVSAMAGAIGKPVFQIGLDRDPFLFGQRDRYAWFPTLRPFNRRLTDPWDPTMRRVAAALVTELG